MPYNEEITNVTLGESEQQEKVSAKQWFQMAAGFAFGSVATTLGSAWAFSTGDQVTGWALGVAAIASTVQCVSCVEAGVKSYIKELKP